MHIHVKIEPRPHFLMGESVPLSLRYVRGEFSVLTPFVVSKLCIINSWMSYVIMVDIKIWNIASTLLSVYYSNCGLKNSNKNRTPQVALNSTKCSWTAQSPYVSILVLVHISFNCHNHKTRLGFENFPGLVKLQQDVRTCEYEDVHVLWEMLERNETGLTGRRKGPFWEFVQWAKHTPLICRAGWL